MPTTLTHGLHSIGTGIGDWLDTFKWDPKIEVSERRNTAGVFGKVKSFNPTNEFSFKGGGDMGIGLGTGSLSITGMSGGCHLIKSSLRNEDSHDFDGHEVGGTHYPGATVAS